MLVEHPVAALTQQVVEVGAVSRPVNKAPMGRDQALKGAQSCGSRLDQFRLVLLWLKLPSPFLLHNIVYILSNTSGLFKKKKI